MKTPNLSEETHDQKKKGYQDKDDPDMHILHRTRSGRCVKTNTAEEAKRHRQEQIANLKQILKKSESERTLDEVATLESLDHLVKHIENCRSRRSLTQSHHEIKVDEASDLESKCAELARLIAQRKGQCVVYTGAGMSTSASIPDYRGPNGLWTMLAKGVKVAPPDFALVQPTYSHMALKSMVDLGIVSHVVSQNCDGLHLRSGLDRDHLSELHGNCFIEFCLKCYQEYARLFDVTERSSFRKHTTGRYCKSCSDSDNNTQELRDSIIHFGERLRDGSPYNWDLAKESLQNARLIICFGSSLKVLKHYQCLWPKKKSNIDICIVNIQWTPKDSQALIKINGYTDDVFERLIRILNTNHAINVPVNSFDPLHDPLLQIAVDLDENEIETTTRSMLNKKSDKSQIKVSSNSSQENGWYHRSFSKKDKKPSQSKKSVNCDLTTDS